MNNEFSNIILAPLKIAFNEAKANGRLVKTNWSVITGAPLSGKTTIIEELALRGYATAPDFGRIIIEKEIQLGKSKISARDNYTKIQEEISHIQNKYLKGLDASKLTFLDYGPPDNLAFLFHRSKISKRILIERSTQFQFKHCYLLDPLKVEEQPDRVRVENEVERLALRQLIESVYACLDVPITYIGSDTAEMRVEKILATELN
jgi:predicted ATPase